MMLVGQEDTGGELTTGFDKRMGTAMGLGLEEWRGQKSDWMGLKASGFKRKWVGNEVDSIRVSYLRERL